MNGWMNGLMDEWMDGWSQLPPWLLPHAADSSGFPATLERLTFVNFDVLMRSKPQETIIVAFHPSYI